jgi:hypothetical protein
MPVALSTTQPSLKANLRDLLKLRSGLEGVQISWGFPKSPANEFILMGDIHDDGEATGALGNQRREETYTLEVLVKVEKNGADQEATTKRAYVLRDEIAQQLRADASVGGAVRQALVVGTGLMEFHSDTVRIAVLTIRIQCKQRT